MKQKLLNDILYVFSVEPYEITEDTEATTIKVQQECYEGFVELNPDLASKIVKYNYHMITVNKQEWADYVDAEEPETKVDPELYWSVETCEINTTEEVYDYPTLVNTNNVTVTYSSSDETVATINSETGEINYLTDGITTISAIFAGNETYNAKIASYSLTFVTPPPPPEPELPAQGTVYNFTGYATQESSDPSSTGTITYEGEWEQDTSYVYGTASATFVGSEEAQSVTVYMIKDDLFLSLDGNRVPVYTIQSDQLVSFGYGELTEYTE